MGYALYEITRNGEKIEAGYAVETVCEEDGCEEQIDRGLAHLCGATPGGDEYGCGGYYCGPAPVRRHRSGRGTVRPVQQGERARSCGARATLRERLQPREGPARYPVLAGPLPFLSAMSVWPGTIPATYPYAPLGGP